MNDIESAWDLIEKYKNNNKSKENGTKDKPEEKNKEASANGIKHKLEEKNEEVPVNKKKKKNEKTDTEVCEENEVFSFKRTILKILQSKGTISSKKLQKKVLNAYLKETGNAEYTEKTVKKYNKKLRKLPNVVVDGEVVSLVSNEH